jgi:hypothetical protein
MASRAVIPKALALIVHAASVAGFLVACSAVAATAGPLDWAPWRLYDAGKEAVMIELTEQQVRALENTETTPPRIVNPRTKETVVLLPVDEYERLKEDEYDDSPWTREELQALAWEASQHAGWDNMDDLDDAQEKP